MSLIDYEFGISPVPLPHFGPMSQNMLFWKVSLAQRLAETKPAEIAEGKFSELRISSDEVGDFFPSQPLP